jgi:hypothetical protein
MRSLPAVSQTGQAQLLKQVPIKGLHKAVLPFEQFAALMCQQALSEQRRLQQARQARTVPVP